MAASARGGDAISYDAAYGTDNRQRHRRQQRQRRQTTYWTRRRNGGCRWPEPCPAPKPLCRPDAPTSTGPPDSAWRSNALCKRLEVIRHRKLSFSLLDIRQPVAPHRKRCKKIPCSYSKNRVRQRAYKYMFSGTWSLRCPELDVEQNSLKSMKIVKRKALIADAAHDE